MEFKIKSLKKLCRKLKRDARRFYKSALRNGANTAELKSTLTYLHNVRQYIAFTKGAKTK